MGSNWSGELASTAQNEREAYRVIVLGPSGAEVLLVPNGERHVLPSVEIPRWQRVAENLTMAVKSEWGEEVVGMFELPVTNDGLQYQAAEHLCTRCDSKMPTRWFPVSALGHDSLIDVHDTEAIEQALAICKGKVEETPPGPFARLGWFSDVRNWVDSVIEPMGFHLTGEFRQLNAGATFSLIRFDTDGPAVWFKAVGEPNLREFAITWLLAKLKSCWRRSKVTFTTSAKISSALSSPAITTK
jgi:hypothetical protein